MVLIVCSQEYKKEQPDSQERLVSCPRIWKGGGKSGFEESEVGVEDRCGSLLALE